jgi:hypothetical protein
MKKIIGLVTVLTFISCSSTPKKLDADKEIISDQGELTRQEMENTAKEMGVYIAHQIQNDLGAGKVYLAFLPTKNDTTEEIAVDLYDQSMVSTLISRKVNVLRVEDRTAALRELQFSQSGATENELEAGKMKSATHFIQTIILENVFSHKGDKIIEHTILTELRSVETQAVLFSKKKVFRKKVARGQISW